MSSPSLPSKPWAELTPEERMERRWPQPVRIGDLIGLPLLDYFDRTLGRVKIVDRTTAGKIRLVVEHGVWLGLSRRRVAVPLEVVAIAGRQLALLDISREDFFLAPPWGSNESQELPANDMTRIALYRR